VKRIGLVVALVGLVLAVAAGAAPVKIGICQIVEHPALDAVRQGVIDGLKDAGYSEGVDVEYLIANAQGDMSNAALIAQNFRAQGVDLVVAIATGMALAVAEVYRGAETPVVFSAITDPVSYALVKSATDPSENGNITGVSDLIDVAADLAILKEIGAKRVGIVYNPGEPNSDVLTKTAKQAAPGLGLSIVEAVADSTANVPLAAQSLLGRVDAVYVTTDNTVVSAIDAVVAVANDAKVPFLVADPTSLKFGPAVATGFDYYEHGKITAGVVAAILGGKRPNQIPVTYQTGSQVHLNLDTAAEIGLTFPQALVEKATSIYYGGHEWEKVQ